MEAELLFIGIDPGTHFLGVAVITWDQEIVNSTVLRPVSDRAPIQDRIQNIDGQFREFLSLYPGLVGAVAVEEPYLRSKVANSALAVTGAYWRTIFTAQESGHRVYVAKPTQIKAIAGKATADKDYMIWAAQTAFRLKNQPSEHVADALWVAVYAQKQFQLGQQSNVQKTQPTRRAAVKTG